MYHRMFIVSIISCFMILSILAEESADVKAEYQQKLKEVQEKNAVDYFQLGKWAKEKKLFGPAKTYLKMALDLKPDYSEAQELLAGEMSGNLPKDYFELVKECRKKLSETEQKCVTRLMTMVKFCKEKKINDEKEFCLGEVLKYNPNCKEAHQERGEVKVENFGWVPKADADKLNNGLREFKGKWLSQKEVEKLRTNNWDNAWEFRTDHYILKTDVSLIKVIPILKLLEEVYGVHLNLFYGIDGFTIPSNKVFNVYYFSKKNDFQQHADQCFPPSRDAPGYYFIADHIAHIWQFQQDDNPPGGTVLIEVTEQEMFYHECTHQTLGICTGDTAFEGDTPGFWISNGVACYFQSYKNVKGKPTFGRLIYQTYVFKNNVLAGKYVPLSDFFKLTKREKPDYGQSAALTLFFMQNEKYKLRFLEYIVKFNKEYGIVEKSFVEFMGIDDLGKLEKEWLEFVKTKL